MENNPYATPSADLGNQEAADTTRYLGFWARVLASIIDNILIMAIAYPLIAQIYGGNYLLTGASATGAHPIWNILLMYVFPFAAIMCFWIYRSATPGKMVFKAKIVDARTGGKPSTGSFVIRYLGYIVCTLTLFIGFLWIAFDRRKQGWHDKMAGTVVVRQ